MEEQLIIFVEKFFKNLGAKTFFDEGVLIVSKVPLNFQKFYGKNEPYKFTLDKEKENFQVEFLEKGSYTLKAISSYLDNSGQTTLLKINFDFDEEEIIKKYFRFPSLKISKIFERRKYDLFFRFTFHTSFQYLNEKEKIIHEIYIHDGEIVNGNLNDYSVVEGIKSEIEIPDMKEAYFIAKEELKKRLREKTNELAENLNKKLEHEIKRIEKHFSSESEELNKSFLKATEKLKELKKEGDMDKISRQEKIIWNLKEKLNFDERNSDKEKDILIEKNKHVLNVNNKLFNTTLIYHPLFCREIELKNEFVKKNLEIVYNPLTEVMKDILCDSCLEKINEIYLCKNGHFVCKNCIHICHSCGKPTCKKCLLTKCSICNNVICDLCKVKCSECGKFVCKTHSREDKFSGRTYCNNCLVRCERCGELKIKTSFKISPKTKAEICEDCYRKEMQKKVLGDVFK